MNRITVEEAKAAYEKANVKPFRGDFYRGMDSDPCACVLGAMMLADGKSPDAVLYFAQSAGSLADCFDGKYDRKYLSGVISGFDAEKHAESVRAGIAKRAIPEEVAGFEDGRAIAKAVFGDA